MFRTLPVAVFFTTTERLKPSAVRLLHVRLANPAVEVALHPRLTVMTRAGGERTHLAARIAAVLAYPRGDGVSGVGEVDGRHLPLTELPPSREAARGVVLRAADLPGAKVRRRAASSSPHGAVVAAGAGEPASDRRDELSRRRDAVRAELAEPARPAAETDAVERALADVRACLGDRPELAGELSALADAWVRVTDELAAGPPAPPPPAALVEAARATLADARAEIAGLEQALGLLSSDDLRRLEKAHREAASARARTGRPFVRSTAHHRLVEAEHDESAALERLGFPSYVAYRLAPSLHPPRPSDAEDLERAGAALADAQAVWDELEAAAEAARRRAAREAEATRLLARVAALLAPEAPGGAGAIQAIAASDALALCAAHARLRGALVAVGASGTGGAVETAEHLLAGQGESHARRQARLAELEAIDIELEAIAPTPTAAPFVDLAEVDPDELEIYLLARLASLRSADEIGPLPLVVDDALAGAPPDVLHRGLALLERMADTVQVLYLSDDREVVEWAAALGSGAAAVR